MKNLLEKKGKGMNSQKSNISDQNISEIKKCKLKGDIIFHLLDQERF